MIKNCNLRKSLGMGRLLAPDNGAGNGESSPTDDTKFEGEDTEEKQSEEKTFTQEEVNKMIKERIAREKKGQLSKEELKAYQEWKDSQKTEEEKQSEALTNAEKGKQDAEDRANTLEVKVTCLSKGVLADSVDDVVILAKAMVSEEVTMEQAVDKVLEKYPNFKGQQQQEEQKGFKIGIDSGVKQKENVNDALARAFGNK